MIKDFKWLFITLVLLIFTYLMIERSQSKLSTNSLSVFSVNPKQVKRFLIQNKSDAIELSRVDSVWSISGNDSLVVKLQAIDSFLNNVLSLEKSTLISKNTDKWSKYSVDDSTGTHLAIIDSLGNTIEYAIFGRSKSDFSRNYVRTHKDPKVYLTNSSILHLLNTSYNYWGESFIPKEEVAPPNKETKTE